MFSRLSVAALAAVSPVIAQLATYQAESAQLSGVTVGTSVAGFTGKSTHNSKIPDSLRLQALAMLKALMRVLTVLPSL